MKLSSASALLVPAFIGLAAAGSAHGDVFIIHGQAQPSTTSNPPTLTPEQARLVFAQRLGVSQYHVIDDVEEDTLSYINAFGGRQESIFQVSGRDKAAELLLLVQGITPDSLKTLTKSWPSLQPAFKISDTPTSLLNLALIEDLQKQVGSAPENVFTDATNFFEDGCWSESSKTVFVDLTRGKGAGIGELVAAQASLLKHAKNNDMNTMVVLMPETKHTKDSKSKPYGSYEMPSQTILHRRQAEEPMTEVASASPAHFQTKQVMTANISEPVTGVPAVCYLNIDSCISATNNCSGHGQCYEKTLPPKTQDDKVCFTCGCVPTEIHFKNGAGEDAKDITYWGGAACQKQDVSGPFWLIAIFTIVMVGLVSWSIGLLFSIGEEKLPGVIGAGVSSKTR